MLSHVSKMYGVAFQRAVDGQEVDAQLIEQIVELCADAEMSPSGVVALHCEITLHDMDRHGYHAQRYAAGMSLLQQVLEGVAGSRSSDRKAVHDLRNSLQVIGGTISLLQRDLRQNSGQRADVIIERLKVATQEMTRRLEDL